MEVRLDRLKSIKTIKISSFIIFLLFLTGCSSLTDKIYESDVAYEIYNVNKKVFYDYGGSPVLVIRSGVEFKFWDDMGNVIRTVGGTKWITKNNYKEEMKIFKTFIDWANLPPEPQREKLVALNNSDELKNREIEFGFFSDGTPAFIDKFQNTFAFERLYLPTIYRFYSEKSIKTIIIESAYAYSMLKK